LLAGAVSRKRCGSCRKPRRTRGFRWSYPVELLIYGWIPLRQERRLIERLLALAVRSGKPPTRSDRQS
jgi:hypothetical protein